MFEGIDRNKYVPQRMEIVFRDGYDPMKLVVYMTVTCCLLGLSAMAPAESPKEKMDQSWMINFCIVMLIYFTCLHALAYFPVFG